MICKNCGKELADNLSVCPCCGYILPQKQQPSKDLQDVMKNINDNPTIVNSYEKTTMVLDSEENGDSVSSDNNSENNYPMTEKKKTPVWLAVIISAVIVIVVLIICTAFYLNSDKTESTDTTTSAPAITTIEQSAQSKSTTAFSTDTTVTSTTTRTSQASTTGWKKAYYDYLWDYMKNNSLDGGEYFNLIYLNDDSIPELVVCPGYAHMSAPELVMYNGSEAKSLGKYGEYGSFFYLERQGIFDSRGMYSGRIRGCEYSFDGNTVNELVRYSCDSESPDSYTINDSPVSQEEYENALHIKGGAKGSHDNSHKLTGTNINNYLG